MTHLKVCESDREFFCTIRLAEFQVSNHSPLVIPSAAEGSAVRLARTQKFREGSGGPAVSNPGRLISIPQTIFRLPLEQESDWTRHHAGECRDRDNGPGERREWNAYHVPK